MARFKFLLVVLVVTATITIATFIPTEIHEYGLETKSGALSIYSEFLLSGSWSIGTDSAVCSLKQSLFIKVNQDKHVFG